MTRLYEEFQKDHHYMDCHRLNLIDKYYIGWMRDGKGRIKERPRKQVANALTSKVGHGISDPRDGLGNTTPHIVYEFE